MSSRNIHPPTSAIRNTLNESGGGKWLGTERASSTSRYTPYSLARPSHREGEGCSRRRGPRYASPESPSFEPRRPKTPEHVESSHRAAPHSVYHGVTAPTPHSSFQAPENHGRPSVSSSDASRPPLRPLNQRPLSLAFLEATDPEPGISSSSNVDKLPPLYKLKRKLVEFQDGSDTVHTHPPLRSAVNSVAGHRTHTLSAVLRVDSPARPAMSSPVDYDKDGEPPEKRFKKNIMDWRVRQQALEEDELLSAVEPKQVFCKPCSKWIKLDARNDFYPGLWKKHRRTMHETDTGSGDKLGDRKSRGRLYESTSTSIEQQPPLRRRTAGSIRAQRQERPSHQDPRIIVMDTGAIRSSSRMTRSSSGASN